MYTNKNILSMLHGFSKIVYLKSASERNELHAIEWKEDDSDHSVLGEVEVIADTIIGIAMTCVEKKPDNIEECLFVLTEAAFYKNTPIVNFLSTNCDNYHYFSGYINIIESLRIATIEFLRDQ